MWYSRSCERKENILIKEWSNDATKLRKWGLGGIYWIWQHGGPQFSFFLNFYWWIVALQCCISFYCATKWISNVTVVQSPSHVQLFANPGTAAHQTSLSLTISWSLPKFVSIALVMASSHLILWSSLLLLPSIFPSIRVFSIKSVLHIRWPKYWHFSFSISPSEEHTRLIFRMDWLDLLAVQGTLKSLLQHHCSKASVLRSFSFYRWGHKLLYWNQKDRDGRAGARACIWLTVA